MSIVRTSRKHRLRPNHRSGAGGDRIFGVIIEDEVRGGVTVHATVDHPTVLPQTDAAQQDGTAVQSQPYVIEHAPRPTVEPVAGGSINKRIRTLSVVPGTKGGFEVAQVEPTWQAFAPAVDGDLVPKGREEHSWSHPNDGAEGELLRIRWKGQDAETGENQETGDGSTEEFTGRLTYNAGADDAVDIAPGSVVLTATIGGNTLTARDTGDGRLVGQETTGGARLDGELDYLTGEYVLRFSAAPDGATNVVADFEHNCRFLPLDIHLDWDAALAQG